MYTVMNVYAILPQTLLCPRHWKFVPNCSLWQRLGLVQHVPTCCLIMVEVEHNIFKELLMTALSTDVCTLGGQLIHGRAGGMLWPDLAKAKFSMQNDRGGDRGTCTAWSSQKCWHHLIGLALWRIQWQNTASTCFKVQTHTGTEHDLMFCFVSFWNLLESNHVKSMDFELWMSNALHCKDLVKSRWPGGLYIGHHPGQRGKGRKASLLWDDPKRNKADKAGHGCRQARHLTNWNKA